MISKVLGSLTSSPVSVAFGVKDDKHGEYIIYLDIWAEHLVSLKKHLPLSFKVRAALTLNDNQRITLTHVRRPRVAALEVPTVSRDKSVLWGGGRPSIGKV